MLMEIQRMTSKKFSEIVRLLKREENKTFQGSYSVVYTKDNVIYRIEDSGYTEIIVIGNKCWMRRGDKITLTYINKTRV